MTTCPTTCDGRLRGDIAILQRDAAFAPKTSLFVAVVVVAIRSRDAACLSVRCLIRPSPGPSLADGCGLRESRVRRR